MPRPRSLLAALVVVSVFSLQPWSTPRASSRPDPAVFETSTSTGHEWDVLRDRVVWDQEIDRQTAETAWFAEVARQVEEARQETARLQARQVVQVRPSSPSTVSYDGDIPDLIRSVFGAIGDQAVNVAHCESTLRPSARNGPNYGLFQISADHADEWASVIGRSFSSSWMDPVANTRFARWLYDESGGWGPWSCRWAA